jgi:hypothetical protein
MRRTTDFFGLLAYLSIMYGRLPDRDMLNAAYTAIDEDEKQSRARLALVPQPSQDETEARTAAA